MRSISIRILVPLSTAPSAPLVTRFQTGQQIIKKIVAWYIGGAPQISGYKITNNGQVVFPDNGIGETADEAGFCGLTTLPLESVIDKKLSGVPGNLEVISYNNHTSDIRHAFIIYFDDLAPEALLINQDI